MRQEWDQAPCGPTLSNSRSIRALMRAVSFRRWRSLPTSFVFIRSRVGDLPSSFSATASLTNWRSGTFFVPQPSPWRGGRSFSLFDHPIIYGSRSSRVPSTCLKRGRDNAIPVFLMATGLPLHTSVIRRDAYQRIQANNFLIDNPSAPGASLFVPIPYLPSLISVRASRRALGWEAVRARRMVFDGVQVSPLQRACQTDPLFPGGVWVPNISS